MGSAISALFDAFLRICYFRMAPQDLPASGFLLGLSLAAYTLLSLVLGYVQLPLDRAILASLLYTGMLVAYTFGLLWLRGVPQRLTQTVTALAGVGVVIGLLGLPVVMWLEHSVAVRSDDAVLASMLWILLFLWDQLITAHVLRHALSIRFIYGFLLSIAYTWLVLSVMEIILPPEQLP